MKLSMLVRLVCVRQLIGQSLGPCRFSRQSAAGRPRAVREALTLTGGLGFSVRAAAPAVE